MNKHLDKILEAKKQLGKPVEQIKQQGGGFKQFVDPENSEIAPESLIEIESQITKLKNKISEFGWLIGKRLIAVRENHLEETNYNNIAEYAEDKFGFKRSTTFNLIFIAHNFSKVQALGFGSKLYLLQRVNEKDRKKYLDWFEKENPSFRDIEEKIKSELNRELSKPKENINLNKVKLTVDFRKMGGIIPEEKSDDFINDLKALITKYLKK
ncbi:MAG: hypothetical protein OEV44_11835 [Spirochaetota bacterium]|nr:hypothetical protein [Spirochaetota bacterium]